MTMFWQNLETKALFDYIQYQVDHLNYWLRRCNDAWVTLDHTDNIDQRSITIRTRISTALRYWSESELEQSECNRTAKSFAYKLAIECSLPRIDYRQVADRLLSQSTIFNYIPIAAKATLDAAMRVPHDSKLPNL